MPLRLSFVLSTFYQLAGCKFRVSSIPETLATPVHASLAEPSWQTWLSLLWSFCDHSLTGTAVSFALRLIRNAQALLDILIFVIDRLSRGAARQGLPHSNLIYALCSTAKPVQLAKSTLLFFLFSSSILHRQMAWIWR
jgi:hypothetical protein